MSPSVTYLHLQPGTALPAITAASPSRAVVICEVEVAATWQAQVSEWLVDSGCLYMSAWGPGCSTWDDSVDMANLERFQFGEIPENRFVMTTWHEDEPLSQALWFAKNNAFHPTQELRSTLLLHISASPRESDLLAAYAVA